MLGFSLSFPVLLNQVSCMCSVTYSQCLGFLQLEVGELDGMNGYLQQWDGDAA